MMKRLFAPSACTMALLVVACSGSDATSTEGSTPSPDGTSTPAPDTSVDASTSTAVVDDAGDPSAADGGIADGAAASILGLGVACTKAEDCPTGFCTDGVCCDEACTGECRSCNQPGKVGTCADVPIFEGDTYWIDGKELVCANENGFACNGKGACKLSGGSTCANPSACVSNVCNDMECGWLAGEPCGSPTECGALTCFFGVCK